MALPKYEKLFHTSLLFFYPIKSYTYVFISLTVLNVLRSPRPDWDKEGLNVKEMHLGRSNPFAPLHAGGQLSGNQICRKRPGVLMDIKVTMSQWCPTASGAVFGQSKEECDLPPSTQLCWDSPVQIFKTQLDVTLHQQCQMTLLRAEFWNTWSLEVLSSLNDLGVPEWFFYDLRKDIALEQDSDHWQTDMVSILTFALSCISGRDL